MAPGRQVLQRLRRRAIKRLRRIRPITPAFERVEEAERIPFLGDPVVGRKGRLVDSPCGVDDYVSGRPRVSLRSNVIFLPSGAAVQGGAYDPWLSFLPNQAPFFGWQDLGLPALLPDATIVNVNHCITYGDWVSEYLKTLVQSRPLASTLLVPGRLRQRGYVARDLSRLGVRHAFVDSPVLIRRATVLHKRRYLVRWTHEDAASYRDAFGIQPRTPVPGSLTYLSRADVPASQYHPTRTYPNAAISRLVEALGGRTLLTARLSPQDYIDAGDFVETVVADHGSAMVNLLFWNCRNVIEVATDGWWGPGMMSLARSCGVRNYAIVKLGDEPTGDLRRIEAWVRRFQSDPDTLW